MKRLFLILILFGVLLCGCERNYGILDYQSKNIVAECVINGEYGVVLTKTDNLCKIEVTEPKAARGITFEIYETAAYVSSGDMKIEIEKEYLSGICAISGIFSQSEECLTSATEEGNGSVLTFETENCHYQITLGQNSVPKNVKITSEAFEYDIEIRSIELS